MATRQPYRAPVANVIDLAEFDANIERILASESASSKPATPSRTTARAAGDVGLALGQGAVGAFKSISDIFGADNAVSSTLGNVNEGLQNLKSDQSKATLANSQRRIQEAEATGDWKNEVAATMQMLWDQPAEMLAQGAGSFATLGIGKLAQAAKLTQAAKAAGVSKAVFLDSPAGREAAKAAAEFAFKANVAVGAGQGVGAVKGSQYEQTMNAAKAQGMGDAEARALASEAQAYGGPGTMQQLLGGVLGAGASATGPIERMVVGKAASSGPVTVLGGMGKAFATEGATEGAQGAQERYAGNEAAIDAGVLDESARWRGVAGQGVQEGVVGGLLGAMPGGVEAMGNKAQAAADAKTQAAAAAQAEADAAAAAIRANKQPGSGPLSNAVNAGTEADAQKVEVAGASAAAAIASAPDLADAAPSITSPEGSAEFINPDFQARQQTLAEQMANQENREKVRARFGDDGLNQVLYYTQAAGRADIPAKTADNMLQVAERMMGEVLLQPLGGDAQLGGMVRDPLTLDAPEQTGAQPLGLGLDQTPSGRFTVDAQGNAVPETAVQRGDAQRRADEMASLGSQKTDILNPSGQPFKTKLAASLAAKKTPGEVVEIPGGYAVRAEQATPATEEQQAQQQAATPATDMPTAATPAASAQSAILGRNSQPIAEGGQPFATREEAKAEKRLQPLMRVAPAEGGGFILKPASERQLAAVEKAAKRLKYPSTGETGPRSLHGFILQIGGLASGTMPDVGFDLNPRVGNRRLFSPRGKTIEQAAMAAKQEGYIQDEDENTLIEALKRSLNVSPVYTPDGYEAMAEAQMQARYEDFLAAEQDGGAENDWSRLTPEELADTGYNDYDEATQAEIRALVAQAEALGVDAESILEDVAQRTENATQKDYENAAKSAIEAAIRSSEESRIRDSGQASAEAGPATADTQSAPAAVTGPASDVRARNLATLKARMMAGQTKPTPATPPAQTKATPAPEAGPTNQGATNGQGQETLLNAGQPTGAAAMVSGAPVADTSLNRDSSWIIREKATGKVVMETFDRAKVDALNAAKYEAVPIQRHLAEQGANKPSDTTKPGGFTEKVRKAAGKVDAAPAQPILTSPTKADIEAQQARAEQAAKAKAAQDKADTARAAKERERKEVAAASVAAADTFELGQDAMANLTGQQDVFGAMEQEAKPTQPKATELTPKQFHEAKLAFIAADTGASMADVRENYDTEAGREENDREWAGQVERAAKAGDVLTRQTLDKLYELAPNVRLPETAIPQGYQRPEARRAEAEDKQARVDGRKAAKAGVKDAAPSFTDLEKELQAQSHATELDGDIGIVAGGGVVRYVSLDDAVSAAKKAIEVGVKAVPFQIHNATGIRIGDVDRVLGQVNRVDYSKRSVDWLRQNGGDTISVSDAIAALVEKQKAITGDVKNWTERDEKGHPVKGIALYNDSAAKKLDAISWAITNLMGHRKKHGDAPLNAAKAPDTDENKVPLSSVIDKVNAKNGQGLTDEDLVPNQKPSVSRAKEQPLTPASTIRTAITKAYGNLLDKLEGKGLVTIAQTEREAIEAAAQARADKTGGDVEQIKRQMLASVQMQRVWHGTPHRGIQQFSTEKIGTGEGAQVYGWGLYFANQKDVADFYRRNLSGLLKTGNQQLDDILVSNGGDLQKSISELRQMEESSPPSRRGIWTDALYVAIELDRSGALIRNGGQLYEVEIPEDSDMLLWDKPLSEQPAPARNSAKTMKGDIAQDWLENELDRLNADWNELTGQELYKLVQRALVDDALVPNAGSMAEQALIEGKTDKAASLLLMDDGIKGIKYLDGTSRNAGDGSYNYVVFDGADTQIVDVKYSANGNIEGFFDKQTGKSFLVADNLTAASAPGTLMHEVGIHMAADGKLEPLFKRAGTLLKTGTQNEFIQRVKARMARAGETSDEEAAAYIVTEYETDRSKAPITIGKWIADLTAAVRAWLFSKGVILKADKLTVADIAAVARANARSMARGGPNGGPGGGIRRSFAGEGAATADKMELATARQRIEAGENAETVRKETGWFKGVDGKWRFEISDSDSILKDRAQWTAKIDAIKSKRDAALRKKFAAEDERNAFLRGRGESPSRISTDTKKTSEFKELAKALKAAEVAADKAYAAVALAERETLITIGDMLEHPALFAAYPGIADVRVQIDNNLPTGNAVYSPESQTITLPGKDGSDQILSVLLHEIQHNIQTIEGFASGGNPDANGGFSKYKRLAGEVEARNTEARKTLTDAQRRAIPPSQTADTPDSDVIVVFNGKDAMSAPAPANADPDIRFSRAADMAGSAIDKAKQTADKAMGKDFPRAASMPDLNDDQRSLLGKVGASQSPASDAIKAATDRAGLKIRQGMVDRFAALKELDEKALGQNFIADSITNSAWVLAKMSSAGAGALNAMMKSGRIEMDAQQKVIGLKGAPNGGLTASLQKLGGPAEVERFFAWMAANRSHAIIERNKDAIAKTAEAKRELKNIIEMQAIPGKTAQQVSQLSDARKEWEKIIAKHEPFLDVTERLFTEDEVAAGRTLNTGTTEEGKVRPALYSQVHAEFQQYRDDVLAIAEQTGIINSENRAMWRDEFYVPFYRVMEDDADRGRSGGNGLSRQEAYKKLKGGKQNLNDLMENTLMNFHHLLSASLKNQAAVQAIKNAEHVKIARKLKKVNMGAEADLFMVDGTKTVVSDKKSITFVLVDGKKVFYEVDDPLVFESITTLADPGLNNTAVRVMGAFKRVFTNMTTATPQFIIANTFRDLLQTSATSPTSKNIAKNLNEGIQSYRDEKTRAEMLASGGAFSFGHIYGMGADEVKASLQKTVAGAGLISKPSMIPSILRKGWDAWGDITDLSENASRAATYVQNVEQMGKLRAAFEARDVMDFSQHGAWPAVRLLVRIVPFLNARLQGLDKLYRSGLKPSILTAMGKGTDTDKQAAARFAMVTGALTLATMALYLVNADDDEYKKLEEWQKDTYWFIRIGENAFFLPKPFEVGAIATMAERTLQQAMDDKATGKLFRERMLEMLMQTFAFNPTPQMFQPLIDVYSNKDAFTGRDIETAGMERMSTGLRSRDTTTAPATALSAVSRVFGDESAIAVSPVQADHLIKGYLGGVGATAAGWIDTMYRAATGQTSPDKAWSEYQPIRRFYRDLDVPVANTRYTTLFYDGLKEANRVYADVMELQKLGRTEEAQALATEKRSVLQMRIALNAQQRRLTEINNRMKEVRRSDKDGEWKRRELDLLTTQKALITERLGKRIEDARATQ